MSEPCDVSRVDDCLISFQLVPGYLTRLFNHSPADIMLNQFVLTLVQRRRQWTNVKPTLIQRLVSAGSLTHHV